MSIRKIRLDRLLVKKGLTTTCFHGRNLIISGKILVNGLTAKPATMVRLDENITMADSSNPFVSRGGLKLAAALDQMQMQVQDLVCMDIGASTGGFTDCLLQHGARRVYAIDVGYGQLAWKLRQDPRVIILERTNIRNLTVNAIAEAVNLVVIDVSFISLKIVVPAALKFIGPGAKFAVLIKPQFEADRGCVGKKGIIRYPDQHRQILEHLTVFFNKQGFKTRNPIPAALKGCKGNQEFFMVME